MYPGTPFRGLSFAETTCVCVAQFAKTICRASTVWLSAKFNLQTFAVGRNPDHLAAPYAIVHF